MKNCSCECVSVCKCARLCNSFRKFKIRINKVRKVVSLFVCNEKGRRDEEGYFLNEFFLHILCIFHAREKMWCARNFLTKTQTRTLSHFDQVRFVPFLRKKKSTLKELNANAKWDRISHEKHLMREGARESERKRRENK